MPRPLLIAVAAGLLATACGASSAKVAAAPPSATHPATSQAPKTTPAAASVATTPAAAPTSLPTPTQHPTRTAKPVLQVGSCKILTQSEAEALLGPVDPVPRITGDDADTCSRLSADVSGGAVQFGKGNASYAAGLAGLSASFLAAFKGPNAGGATGTVTHEGGLGGGGVLLTEHDPGRPTTYSIYWLQGGRILNLNVVHAAKATPAKALHLAHVLAGDAG
ncbi:hypothetical protein acdb102_46830 [Acidothermaceae bacterium B102]|nr:hypothetical protein acdb102_46830 [Acidothermaceae bacterium B102]